MSDEMTGAVPGIAEFHPCTDCSAYYGQRIAGRYVIYAADGLAKFACGNCLEKHQGRWEDFLDMLERIYGYEAAMRLGATEPPQDLLEEKMTIAEAWGFKMGWHRGRILRCRGCKKAVFGGPTRCRDCAEKLAV